MKSLHIYNKNIQKPQKGENFMRNNFSQISLFDIYSDISDAIEERDLSFFDLLDEHLDLGSLIPDEFYRAFYKFRQKTHLLS